MVTTPWSGEAQSLCEEEREIIGLSLEPLSDQGLSVATLEPLGFAARSGIQVGDVIEQANNQLLRDCRGYRKAVQEAKKDKKALLLLINTKKGKRAVAFERAVWEEPEKKATEAVASLKTLLETPLLHLFWAKSVPWETRQWMCCASLSQLSRHPGPCICRVP